MDERKRDNECEQLCDLANEVAATKQLINIDNIAAFFKKCSSETKNCTKLCAKYISDKSKTSD